MKGSINYYHNVENTPIFESKLVFA